MLVIDNVTFSYSDTKVLDSVSLSVDSGGIAALIGTSGAGKSTLFRLITNILQADSGTITVDGIASDRQSRVAYMMQDDLLLPWRTALRNVTLAAELGKAPQGRQEAKEKGLALLESMGMAHASHLLPEQLSGGMRQRVALARALMLEKPLLLLDEPFGALDIALREQMTQLLLSIQAEHKLTILFITHDFRDALTLADTIFFLKEGAIQQSWEVPKDLADSPEALGTMHEKLRSATLKPETLT